MAKNGPNGTVYDTGVSASLSQANNWTYTFENLARYTANDEEIIYSIAEVAVSGYSSAIGLPAVDNAGNYSFTVTNTKLVNVTVRKVWVDGDTVTHPNVVIKLMAQNGPDATPYDTGTSVTLPYNGSWTYTFENLARTTAAGVEIIYSIQEEAVTGYDSVISGPTMDESGNYSFTVTNTPKYDLVVEKRDKASASTILPGAQFDLYLEVPSGTDGAVVIPNAGSGATYGIKQNTAAYATDSKGRITLAGLLPGTYWLVETVVPTGYYAPTTAFGFTLGTDGALSALTNSELMRLGDKNGIDLIILNQKGYELPDAGGPGTRTVTWLGIALMALSSIMYMAGRSKKRERGAGRS
jgi:hypothetical protein